eukprot:gene26141-biopygen14320
MNSCHEEGVRDWNRTGSGALCGPFCFPKSSGLPTPPVAPEAEAEESDGGDGGLGEQVWMARPPKPKLVHPQPATTIFV